MHRVGGSIDCKTFGMHAGKFRIIVCRTKKLQKCSKRLPKYIILNFKSILSVPVKDHLKFLTSQLLPNGL